MEKHSRREDWIAILTGTFLVAQGVFFLQSASLLTGGTTGLALLASQFVSFSFGTLYFIANCPFYLLAWKRFGSRFAFNSAISGALVSVFADHLYLVISLDTINEVYCAVAGGLLMGLGMLILFRHRSSLGGFNVLCLFIQDKFGISVGKSQLAIDFTILVASFFFVSPQVIVLSIIGAIALNLVLAMNHKPTRYSVNYG
ncbi:MULTISPECIES: YitT family protein [Vibrio oreintalis group]|uniref:YitT family protein n=1 Tax=Vibrio oreintalis group TaxID=1891919 RepID=UPI00148C9926|nr:MULTISPECIES: YitT family protein [Vibrio oreintalis group]MDC5819712.1 YitT family protein [Vibrio europaeus]MDC5856265.1 YitT family protein [Vibrio europaeus]MDC5868002.1 YitT family protein [Vibrio europaeus]NOH25799.1 YitT family protein [Vibrio europaeus]WCP66443.1 YitT family protein [Vibrio tubiashii]